MHLLGFLLIIHLHLLQNSQPTFAVQQETRTNNITTKTYGGSYVLNMPSNGTIFLTIYGSGTGGSIIVEGAAALQTSIIRGTRIA